ncbi:MAG: metallophosphoesterase family protein [Planctomycetes bacterium]|nr:metallophosphoesterase family protein [Planctomycetota bacterium]
MKLGLITDIHEHVGYLRAALIQLEQERVDQIVILGDVFEHGRYLDETCQLLSSVAAIGVWGNHDYGLCVAPTDESRQRYSADTLRFMESLQPRMIQWGCHFSHVEPWLNPEQLEDLWYFEGLPDEQHKRDRIFAAVPHEIMFGGHYHCWLLTRPNDIQPWTADHSIRLTDGRYFVVIGALCEGSFATFDTDTLELTPRQVTT